MKIYAGIVSPVVQPVVSFTNVESRAWPAGDWWLVQRREMIIPSSPAK